MERMCAEPMFKYLKSIDKKTQLFLPQINSIKVAQARIYVGGDIYIAEGTSNTIF